MEVKKPKPKPRKQSPNVSEKLDGKLPFPDETLGFGDTLSYLSPGQQKNVLRKLRRGHYGVDAELDLHGLNSKEAKHHLLHFLHHCVEDGFRCVHIIHGKGYRSPDNRPILKNNLNLWLRQHQDVLAFCSAAPKDGGSGAVLVLLHLSQKYSEQEDTEY